MQQCEGVLLGREPVDGTVNASTLASLIRTLLASRERLSRSVGSCVYGERRRFVLRCRDGIEIIPSKNTTRPRRVDDEGFESDDDTASTKSATSIDDTVSNSSSCCFVDDHVFKFPAGTNSSSRGVTNSTSSTSSVATDSANSSGASDTDDVDTSASPSPASGIGSVSKLVQSLTLFQRSGGIATTKGNNNNNNNTNDNNKISESYSVTDIAFCHTDPNFPKVIVWVVKKRRSQRLTCSGTDNATSGLEAIVFECQNERGLKKVHASFQEISRRAKLDQYRHPHRRKDLYPTSNPTTTTITSAFTTQSYSLSTYNKHLEKDNALKTTTYTPSPLNKNADIPKSYNPKITTTTNKPSTTIDSNVKHFSNKPYNDAIDIPKAYAVNSHDVSSPKPFAVPPKTLPKPIRPAQTNPKEDAEVIPPGTINKFNLVQRTDGDGMTHIEVSRGVHQESLPVETFTESAGPSSIISINTPDAGNMLSSSNGVPKSRLCKEIEGVIRTDIDASGVRREVTSRQRQPAILVMNGAAEESGGELHKVWSPPKVEEDEDQDDDQQDVIVRDEPPQRPERRKYLRKKPPAPEPPVNRPSPDLVNSKRPQIPHRPEILIRNQKNQQKIVRGQFIRVSVDQPQPQQQQLVVPMVQSNTPWMYSNAGGNTTMMAYSTPNWGIPLSAPLRSSTSNRESGKHGQRRGLDDLFTGQHSVQQKHHRRSRSSGGSGRSKSPPINRRPMAYRYIDVGNPPPSSNTTNTLSNRFFGLSQKLRELGGSSNSGGQGHPYATTGRRRGSGGECQERCHMSSGGCQGNLKSVIKKGKRTGEYVEPKKVTFSAYATVQVVD